MRVLVPTALTVTIAVVLLVAAGFVYYRVGWYRMTTACAPDQDPVSYSWTWRRGFQCSFADGTERSSFGWMT